MTRRLAAVPLLVAGILGGWTMLPTGRAQDHGAPPADRAGVRPQVDREDFERNHPAESEPDFRLWKRKAQLELEILQAQVEAKKAEIRFRESEFRAKAIGRDLATLTKLEMPVRMSFARETPLEDVLKYVRGATRGPDDDGLPIYVDPVSLQEAGATMSSTVSIDLEGIPLKTTLRLVLKQLGLIYKVEGGLLTITSPIED